MRETRSVGAGLLVVLAAAFAGSSACSTTSEGPPPRSSDQPVITGQPAGFDSADIAFANDTITHHQQSIELATLVPDRSTSPEPLALAPEISAEQTSEVDVLKVFLVQWNENPGTSPEQNSQGGAPGGVVPGLVDDATVTRLKSLSGKEFDTLWLQSMIGHGQGVVTIAEAEIAHGANVDAIATAKRIVESQQAQIGQMQQMLGAG